MSPLSADHDAEVVRDLGIHLILIFYHYIDNFINFISAVSALHYCCYRHRNLTCMFIRHDVHYKVNNKHLPQKVIYQAVFWQVLSSHGLATK